MPMFQQASDHREQLARQRLSHCRWDVSDEKVSLGMGWKMGAVMIAVLGVIGANAAFGATGLSPSGPSQQAVSSASPLQSLSQGELQ